MPAYLCVAYRWGWTNAHHYFVACSTDQARVVQAAQLAHRDRRGKYGVAVLEMPDVPGQAPEKRIQYLPSAYGESAPFENQRIEANRMLGQRVFSVVAHNQTIRQDANDPSRKRFVPVSVPGWLREEAEEFARLGGIAPLYAASPNSKKP